MNNLVEINNVALGIKEYNGQRIVTFKDIDKVHERVTGTARRAFNRNKRRFILETDYYMVKRDSPMSVSGTLDFDIPPKGLTFI